MRLNGPPVQGLAFKAISSVRVTDSAGFISDTAEIVVANTSFISWFAMPEPVADVEIKMGYLGSFKHMGVYVADEVEESSPPRSITFVCRAKAQGETESGFAPILQ
jgi:phage protein D